MIFLDNLYTYLSNHSTVNVLVAGITCSGKTTLANKIQDYFSNEFSVTVVSQDDYFKNLPDIPRTSRGYLTDSIDAFCTREFVYDVHKLLQDSVVMMPRYDIATNTRLSKNKIVRKSNVMVFEGLHTIQLLNNLDSCISIFINTDISTCLERRVKRDTSKYGVSEIRIRKYWNECIMPMSEKFIFPQKDHADFIINCKGGEIDDC